MISSHLKRIITQNECKIFRKFTVLEEDIYHFHWHHWSIVVLASNFQERKVQIKRSPLSMTTYWKLHNYSLLTLQMFSIELYCKNSKNYRSDEIHTITISKSHNLTISHSHTLTLLHSYTLRGCFHII